MKAFMTDDQIAARLRSIERQLRDSDLLDLAEKVADLARALEPESQDGER